MEIGVGEGGSLQLWRSFFGPRSLIIGVDNDPKRRVDDRPGMCVRIGHQADHSFLGEVIADLGMPDIVIDDGSHHMHDMLESFMYLYPPLGKNGIYVVEDLPTCYWEEYGGGVNEPRTFVNVAKGFIDRLNALHTRGAVEPNFITDQTFGISFYDSMVVFEKSAGYERVQSIVGGGR